MIRHQISLLPHQMRFLNSDAKFSILTGGIGSGKSHAFRVAILKRAIIQHKSDLGLITAGTADQLRDTVLDPLQLFLEELGIENSYNRNTKILNIASSRFLCTGLDNPGPLRGIEVGSIFGDEAAFYKKEAMDIILGRLRNKYAAASYGLQARFTTSPNGRNHFYDKFVSPDALLPCDAVTARIRDNVFLDIGYIESLYRAYSSRQALQELEGEYIDMSEGGVYWAFEEERNVRSVLYQPELPILVGMDFNVNPMTAVLSHYQDNRLYIFDEIYLEHSNTFRMAQAISSKYGNAASITVYPDASGSSRKTSATDSDHQILRDSGFLVRTQRSNPRKEDRYNTVNKRLEDSQILIDRRCTKTIRDLAQVTHESNPSHLTHISDALGYLTYGTMPLKRPARKSSTILY